MPKKSFFPDEPVTPSRVRNSLFISYHGKIKESEKVSDYTDEDDSEDSDEASLLLPFVKVTENMQKWKELKKKNLLREIYSGKWMLFHNNKSVSLERGMTHHDYMWQFAKKLVDDSENTFITSVHASTGNPFQYGTDPKSQDGLICCFTKDYRNKFEVRKAAERIRQVLYYPNDMFYKTDEATISGNFIYFGCKYVSLYKFTTDNKLYERDQENVHQWNLVKLEI